MRSSDYHRAVAKLAVGERVRHIGAATLTGAALTRDECAAVLYALRQLTEAGRRPPRFPVETDPPGMMPAGAMDGADAAREG